jgi:hypothetical protein
MLNSLTRQEKLELVKKAQADPDRYKGAIVLNYTNPFWSRKKHVRLFSFNKHVHCAGCGRRAIDCKNVENDVGCNDPEEEVDYNKRRRRPKGA